MSKKITAQLGALSIVSAPDVNGNWIVFASHKSRGKIVEVTTSREGMLTLLLIVVDDPSSLAFLPSDERLKEVFFALRC